MTPKETFMIEIEGDTLRRSDAIVVLEGGGLERLSEAARLFREGWAPVVVLSGGLDKPPESIPAPKLIPYAIDEGIPERAIILEAKSRNTREQALEVIALAREKNWKAIILVASHYHHFRAFLTFLKVLQELGMDREVALTNAAVPGVQTDLLEQELEKIERYGAHGHVASYEDAVSYFTWRKST